MLYTLLLIISCMMCVSIAKFDDSAGVSDNAVELLSSLRNDANLDLPVDEEYEDLRAELFAYSTALESLSPSRRSMLTTQCWRRGGICVSYKLCPGYRQLTEIPGCKNRHNVCCFVWNQYQIRELKDQGIDNLAFPWHVKTEFGGQGIQEMPAAHKSKKFTKNQIKKKKQARYKNTNKDNEKKRNRLVKKININNVNRDSSLDHEASRRYLQW